MLARTLFVSLVAIVAAAAAGCQANRTREHSAYAQPDGHAMYERQPAGKGPPPPQQWPRPGPGGNPDGGPVYAVLAPPCMPLCTLPTGSVQHHQTLSYIEGVNELNSPVSYRAEFFHTAPPFCQNTESVGYSAGHLSCYLARGLVAARGTRPAIRTPRVPGSRPKYWAGPPPAASSAPANDPTAVASGAAGVRSADEQEDTLVAWRTNTSDIVYFYSTSGGAEIDVDFCHRDRDGRPVTGTHTLRNGQFIEIFDDRCTTPANFNPANHTALINLVKQQHGGAAMAYPGREYFDPFEHIIIVKPIP